jgi:hypothetical protein
VSRESGVLSEREVAGESIRVTRTAPAKTRAHTVNTFVRFYLADENAARFDIALPDVWRIVQYDRHTIAGDSDNARYRKRLAI